MECGAADCEWSKASRVLFSFRGVAPTSTASRLFGHGFFTAGCFCFSSELTYSSTAFSLFGFFSVAMASCNSLSMLGFLFGLEWLNFEIAVMSTSRWLNLVVELMLLARDKVRLGGLIEPSRGVLLCSRVPIRNCESVAERASEGGRFCIPVDELLR